jgi:long-chain acyl-CoA synthetase
MFCPQVESELKTCPYVENCCVYGDSSQSYVVALIVPDRIRLEQLAENLGIQVRESTYLYI